MRAGQVQEEEDDGLFYGPSGKLDWNMSIPTIKKKLEKGKAQLAEGPDESQPIPTWVEVALAESKADQAKRRVQIKQMKKEAQRAYAGKTMESPEQEEGQAQFEKNWEWNGKDIGGQHWTVDPNMASLAPAAQRLFPCTRSIGEADLSTKKR